ncbi:MAG: histidine kinase [Bacteroidia bacterium]|nr:histidine kinase [Bacteroidia bacterium]
MQKRYLNTLLYLLFLISGKIFGQQSLRFNNYSIEEGLSQSTLQDIFQTKDGFIWFGTADGLNKFDGYQFHAYKHDAAEPGSLSSSFIESLGQDDSGNLWVGTHEGILNIFNKQKNHFTVLKQFSDHFTQHSPIKSIKNDGKGHMWIATEGSGIACYDLKKGTIRFLNTENAKLISNTINCLFINKKTLWYGTPLGISSLKINSDTSLSKTFLENQEIYAINIYQGKLYVATGSQGLFILNNGKMESVALPLNGGEQYSCTFLLPDHLNNLWVGTLFNGIHRISENGKIETFLNNPLDKTSLGNNIIRCGIEDNTGNIWLGTYSGISSIKPLNQQLHLLQHNPLNINSLSNNNIYFIYQDHAGFIWLGTLEGGLDRYDPATQNIEHYNTSNSKGLTSNSIRSVYQDSKNRYYVGTGTDGLFRFYPEERRFEEFTDKFNYTTSSVRITSIAEDARENLWIATFNGLDFYDTKADTIAYYLFDNENEQNNNIIEIKLDKKNDKIWIASFGNGLQIFDIATKKYTKTYSHDPKNPMSISNNQLLCVNIYNDDTLMVGTFGGGLNIFDIKSEIFTSITEKDGLPNDAVYGILGDKKGYLWVSTNRGLSRIGLRPTRFKNFDQINLVQSLEFNEGAYLAGRDGNFYFGGINGLNFFVPESLKVNKFVPPVEITGFKVLDRELPFRELSSKDGILTLQHNQNFISIDFVALNYINPEKTTYSYKLEGIDDDWVMAGNKRTANYTKLPPGSYIFRVRAANEDGVWNEEGASLNIYIRSPFWKTWWFFMLIGLSALGVIYLVLHARTNAIRKSYQAQMTEVELKALRSQMNPHFIFNSINSIQYYILNKNPKTAYTYLSKFSSLMRMILQNSRINYITIEDEIESLQLYLELENIRLDNELNCTFDIDPLINQKNTQIPSMVIQPFVENAILHGLLTKQGNKSVTIRMQKEISHIYCEVEDNGIGREKARELNELRTKKHESTGMKATRQRLDILNRNSDKKLSVNIIDMFNENETPSGTKVQIFIPITNKSE